ncbi:MAG: DUF177 domain-containing protein [Clostridia bacterium]|nr:DUF177 domain-containing protein [Clostridia bacterium]
MILDISNLKGVPGKEIRDSLEVNLSEKKFSEYEHKFLEPIVIDFIAVNKGDHIYLSGEIKTLVELICGRCLKKIEFPVAMPFAEKFFQETQAGQTVDQEALDEGYTHSGNQICLDDLIEQYLVLNLPLKIVCQDACKGFCPKCGINLNYEHCECAIEEVDPRLAVLEKLLMSSSSPKEVEK